MNRLLAEPLMVATARERHKGLVWIVEILVFYAVYSVASMLEMLLMIIGAGVSVAVTPESAQAVATAVQGGNFFDIYDVIIATLRYQPTLTMLLNLFCTIASIIVCLLFCRVIQKRSLYSVGFDKHGFIKEYLLGLGTGAVMLCLTVGGVLALKGGSIGLAGNTGFIILLYAAGYMIQGAAEEILCRGYFMTSFARRHPLWLSILLSSVMFGLLHIFNDGFGLLPFINITLVGICFALLTVRRGNLWIACAAHSVWNFLQGNFFGISVSGTSLSESVFRVDLEGSTLLTGGAFGIEGSIVTTVVMVAAILLILFLMPKRMAAFQEEA